MPGLEGRGRDIVPVGEQRALVLKGREALPVSQQDLKEPSEVYLGTPVFQGEYGVASFALVIPRPNPRPSYFIAQEGPCGSYGDINDPENQESIQQQFDGDFERASHYYSTDRGFSVVRVVAAPLNVVDKLKSDRFLGPAVINKCTLDGTVPYEFDEETGLSLYDSVGQEKIEEIEKIEDPILRNLGKVSNTEFRSLRYYPSWHSYRLYGTVMDQINDGCQRTVANFDQILAMMIRDLPRLHDFSGGTELPRGESAPRELPQ